MSSVNNVCRLCLSKQNLVWVFDKRFDSTDNMKDVVFVTTGVEVYKEDVISQKICNKCCHIAIKMFQFRNVSQKHDRYLKEQYKEMLKTASLEDVIPSTSEAVKMEIKVEPKRETKEVKSNYQIHKSVTDLFKIYPRLKLPSTCLQSDVEPWVMMEMNRVENYLKNECRGELKRTRFSKPENKTAKKSTSAASTSIDPLRISSRSVLSIEKNCQNDSVNKIVHKKSESTTVSVAKNVNTSDCHSDDESDIINRSTVLSKKRRLSDSDFFLDTDAKESSSKLLHKENPIGESADELCLDKSVPLFICSICNSVHNNAGALRRHNYKHLHCPFCRKRFKTISSKEEHIKSMCAIKNMMNHLPSVKLKKVELDLMMRIKYPAAFIGYPSIPGLQLNSSSTNETSEDEPSDDHLDNRALRDEISGNMTSEEEKNAVDCNDDNDIIEIFSDEETNITPVDNTSNSTHVRRKDIAPPSNGAIKSECSSTNSTIARIVSSIAVPSPIFTVTPGNSSITPYLSTTPSIISDTSSVISSIPPVILSNTPPLIATTPSAISTDSSVNSSTSLVNSTISPFIPEDTINPSCIVKPDIKIKRSTVLETIDPRLTDIKVLKELLTNYTEFRLEKEESSQTELPSNQSICLNGSDNSTELKHLKNVLFAYKIPISIRKGEFLVRYDFNSSNFKPRPLKKLCLWNDLIPIDVKVGNESSNNEGSVNSVITSEVSTPNLPLTGVTSNCNRTLAYSCNPSFVPLPNQQVYGRNNSFSTPVNSFNGASNVQVYPQVVSSSYGFVKEAPGSKDLAYVLVRSTAAEQQSNANMVNSFTASNVQMYPQTINVTSPVPSNFGVANSSVTKDPINVRPLSYLNNMRGPPNINPFLNVAVPKTSPVLSINSTNNAPPNVSNSHSMIYNLQNSMVIQNKVPNPVPNLAPISSTSNSNEAGPVFGTIRVKNVWELT